MIKRIDDILNSITMYRLILYYLILLLLAGFIYSIFGILPFSATSFAISILFIVIVCFGVNKLFEKTFKAQTNIESLFITALILASILTPAKIINDFVFLFAASLIAMASKYILAIRTKHIFNPAAIGAVIGALVIGKYASWWVGTLWMFPFTLLGILIVRKIRRFNLIFSFLIVNVIVTILSNHSVVSLFTDSPILFFGFIMLTEPLTTPPTRFLQILYGALTGILFAPLHFGAFFTTPEIALSIGNAFSYIVSPKQKLILKLKEKLRLNKNTYDFIFTSQEKLKFKAGQYLEWTLSQKNADTRGNRRYFTIASAPTENEIRIGIKLPEDEASSFKREMIDMKVGQEIIASQLAGDFTLPNDNKKLLFIAGGIGITPYRSMIKYLIDTNIKRDIVLMYSEKNINEMVYKDVFKKAIEKLGIKVIYFETDKKGHMVADILVANVADYKERNFYLSGSHVMVSAFENILKELKIPKIQTKVDYFPGY
ncbi:hypothetical protein BH10PAT1_BH10PAT1_2760 [soil metagenome]